MRSLFLVLLLIWITTAKKLQVALYYESLCPDSIRFVTEQLYPHYKDIGKYLDLDLVPFGFATSDNSTGHWEFKCQHGPPECYLNKVHSCVIANNTIPSSLEFINCAMTASPASNNSLEICANASNISWSLIQECLSSEEGDDLLVENGKRTRAVSPPISYIPTIIFNGVYNKKTQKEAERHFLEVVCQLLKSKPDICKILGIIFNIIT